jgi:hypothetical protein
VNIRFPPLINVTADLVRAKFMLGQVVMEMEVRGKPATISMPVDEVKKLIAALKAALPPAGS